MPHQKQNFSDTTPAAPAGFINVMWQCEPPGPVQSVRHLSAYVPVSGSGPSMPVVDTLVNYNGGDANANTVSYPLKVDMGGAG